LIRGTVLTCRYCRQKIWFDEQSLLYSMRYHYIWFGRRFLKVDLLKIKGFSKEIADDDGRISSQAQPAP
jgi:hypothetical protein